jgi:thiamine biosynthesis lipoprotein
VAEADSELRWVLQECEQWTARTGGWFSAYPAGVLDPSGYVKGWAIQRASDLLAAAGSTAHSVNGGGDVRTVGSAAPGQPWRVGIADPNRAGRLITVIAGSDCAVATSGVAERGQHILDPHTARAPVSDIVSLTVTGRDLIECDVLATAAFAMGEAAQDWLGNWAGVNAFAVRADGSTWSTFPGPTDTTVAQVTPT